MRASELVWQAMGVCSHLLYAVLCRFGECGRQQRGECGLLHDPNKVAVCAHWLAGSCSAGAACKRQHKVGWDRFAAVTMRAGGSGRLCSKAGMATALTCRAFWVLMHAYAPMVVVRVFL
jgi:hypothetical protein